MALIEIEELEKASPIFRGKAGNAIAKGIMGLLGIDRIQEAYDRNSMYTGPDFARHILEDFGIEYRVSGQENLAALPNGPFITISNHPYGSIDGLILTDIFGHIRPDFKVMVNKFLGRIEAMGSSFITVTPNGAEKKAPDRESMAGVRASLRHLRAGHPLGLFPSGAVSDLSLKDRCIRDREWQEAILRLIKKAEVPVVPVRFFDRNSDFYYSLGLIDWRIRLLRLPGEVLNKRGKRTRVGIGPTITPEAYAGCESIGQFGKMLRNSVYCMVFSEDFAGNNASKNL